MLSTIIDRTSDQKKYTQKQKAGLPTGNPALSHYGVMKELEKRLNEVS